MVYQAQTEQTAYLHHCFMQLEGEGLGLMVLHLLLAAHQAAVVLVPQTAQVQQELLDKAILVAQEILTVQLM